MSPAHFHRIFKKITGVTPKHYAIAVRGNRLRHALAGSQSVTRAMYDAGFGSNGSFYGNATDDLGRTGAGIGAIVATALGVEWASSSGWPAWPHRRS